MRGNSVGATSAQLAPRVAPPPVNEVVTPVLSNVLDRMSYFNQIASETESVLDSIAGKLFGFVEPENAPGSMAADHPNNGFTESFGDYSHALTQRLMRIDAAVREINSRL